MVDTAEKITRLDLTVDERDTLTTAWGVICALLENQGSVAAAILTILRSSRYADGLRGVTQKLGQVQEEQLEELLERIDSKFGPEDSQAIRKTVQEVWSSLV